MAGLGEFIGMVIGGLLLPLVWLLFCYIIPPLRRKVDLKYKVAIVLSCLLLLLLVSGSAGFSPQALIAALACPGIMLWQRKRAMRHPDDTIKGQEAEEAERQPTLPHELSIETLALIPIKLMSDELTPFSEWKSPDVKLDAELEKAFQIYVWIYQFYAFYILCAGRWGYEVSDKLLSIQKDSLSKVSERLAYEFETGVKQVHENLNRHVNNPGSITIDGKETEVPCEYGLAVEFLTLSPDSPFYTTEEQLNRDGPPQMNEADWKLAFCLEHGKEAAMDCFSTILDNSKVYL